MHVVAVHRISDPESFFDAVQSTPIPEGFALRSMLPSADRSRAVCVWEAESTDSVRKLGDETVGDVSDNEFFEVDAAGAQGLPA
jgi:hypothetical protein